jgi:quercetin dioxygenase-like cupin family protein
MIVKSKNGKRKEFKGVSFDVLAVGEKSMIARMNFKKNDNVPFHCHPNEQNGYVVSGKFILKLKGIEEIITEGDSYTLAENVLHSIEVIEPGIIIDTFTPPREDYI